MNYYNDSFDKKRFDYLLVYNVKKLINLSDDKVKESISRIENGMEVISLLLEYLEEGSYKGYRSPQQHLEVMFDRAKGNLIPERDLEWLKLQRATSFIFDFLHLSYRQCSGNQPSLFDVVLPARFFERKGERMTYEASIKLIDLLCQETNRHHIESFLTEKKEQWLRVYNKFNNPFWFPDSKCIQSYYDDYRWVFNYFEKHNMTKGNVEKFNDSPPNLVLFSMFDKWAVEQTEPVIELFILKMKKAWGQKKFRDSVKEKKVLNTYINKESKKQLDFLAKKNDRKINEEIEAIIHDAYMRMKFKY
ncbi:hypothetical protein ACSOQX_003071 [Yersinia enterocolitica]|nr:hypothetical protein [Yersinia enterocolitica]